MGDFLRTGLSLGRSFFRRSFFLRLVLAKLVGVFRFSGLCRSFLIPIRELYAIFLEDKSDTRRGLGTVFEIELEFFFVEDDLFGFWVIVADLSHNAPRERVTLGFLDDYPVHREVCAAITLHTNREHWIFSLVNSFFILHYSLRKIKGRKIPARGGELGG